jgi:hypothetical protein
MGGFLGKIFGGLLGGGGGGGQAGGNTSGGLFSPTKTTATENFTATDSFNDGRQYTYTPTDNSRFEDSRSWSDDRDLSDRRDMSDNRDLRAWKESYNTGSYNTVNTSTWLNIEGGASKDSASVVDSALQGVASINEAGLSAGLPSYWPWAVGAVVLALLLFWKGK